MKENGTISRKKCPTIHESYMLNLFIHTYMRVTQLFIHVSLQISFIYIGLFLQMITFLHFFNYLLLRVQASNE